MSRRSLARTAFPLTEESTATLRGIGPGLSRHGCPACHMKREAMSVEPAAAFAFGMALVLVRGADPARSVLCRPHASLVELLAADIRNADGT